MEKKSKGKAVVIVILVLVILGLVGYIVYDKIVVNDNTTKLQNQVKSLTQKIQKMEQSDSSNTDMNNEIQKLIGAYSGTIEAPAEIGRPVENVELLINDKENVVFCSQIGTGLSCYKGTYFVKGEKLFLNFIEIQEFDFLSNDEIKEVKKENYNGYKTFTINSNKLIYDFENLSGNLSKTEVSKLNYINNIK